jgi:non-ribosomal peptide synthetase component F
VYGPTETTIWSTFWKAVAGQAVQIGKPVRNTSLAILDDDMREVPEGAAGSLWIGGDGLSPGALPALARCHCVHSCFR